MWRHGVPLLMGVRSEGDTTGCWYLPEWNICSVQSVVRAGWVVVQGAPCRMAT